MKSKHTIIMALLASILFACETVVEVDLPDTESKLVLNGLFAPDQEFFFTLSASKGILDSGSLRMIDNGSVEISGSDGSTELITTQVYDSLKLFSYGFKSVMKAKRGVTYTVVAKSAGYSEVRASASMPQSVAISSVDTATIYSNGYPEGQSNISFIDPGNEVNFYEIKFYQLVYFPEFDSNLQIIGFETFEQELYPYASDDGFFNAGSSQLIFNDELFNGQEFTTRLNYYKDFFTGDTMDVTQFLPSFLVVELRSLSSDYYKFQTTYSSYQTSSFDPFAQPVLVYNNVEGGFGIFAGFNSYRDTIPLNKVMIPKKL